MSRISETNTKIDASDLCEITFYVRNDNYSSILEWGRQNHVRKLKQELDILVSKNIIKDFSITFNSEIILTCVTDSPDKIIKIATSSFNETLLNVTSKHIGPIDLSLEYYRNGYNSISSIVGKRENISREEFHNKVSKIISQPCDVIELGVMEGDSMKFWCDNINGSSFIGFDTFNGIDKKWVTFDTDWKTVRDFNMMKTDIPNLSDPRCKFIKGYIQDTLRDNLPHKNKPWFVHFDMDIYDSTLFGLYTLSEYFEANDYILFDEFNDNMNEFKAWNDYIMSSRTKNNWELVLANQSQYLFKII
jgi:hypothetical protein